MEALEAYALPSSRLANEAAGTTTRFIQDSPHLLSHTGCELRSDSTSDPQNGRCRRDFAGAP